MTTYEDYKDKRLKSIRTQPRVWEAFGIKAPLSATQVTAKSRSPRERARRSLGGLTTLPRRQRVPTFYSRPDVVPSEDRLFQRVAEARRAGDDRLLLIYRPKEYWDNLYKESPSKYYARKYKISTALLCQVCQNEHCGWDQRDLASVDRAHHHAWVCPHCTTLRENLKTASTLLAIRQSSSLHPQVLPLARQERSRLFLPAPVQLATTTDVHACPATEVAL